MPDPRRDYLVFLSAKCDIDYGYMAPVRVHSESERDAVDDAVGKWWSGQFPGDDAIAVVVPVEHATAYVLGEIRGVEITAEAPLPDLAASNQESERP